MLFMAFKHIWLIESKQEAICFNLSFSKILDQFLPNIFSNLKTCVNVLSKSQVGSCISCVVVIK